MRVVGHSSAWKSSRDAKDESSLSFTWRRVKVNEKKDAKIYVARPLSHPSNKISHVFVPYSRYLCRLRRSRADPGRNDPRRLRRKNRRDSHSAVRCRIIQFCPFFTRARLNPPVSSNHQQFLRPSSSASRRRTRTGKAKQKGTIKRICKLNLHSRIGLLASRASIDQPQDIIIYALRLVIDQREPLPFELQTSHSPFSFFRLPQCPFSSLRELLPQREHKENTHGIPFPPAAWHHSPSALHGSSQRLTQRSNDSPAFLSVFLCA